MAVCFGTPSPGASFDNLFVAALQQLSSVPHGRPCRKQLLKEYMRPCSKMWPLGWASVSFERLDLTGEPLLPLQVRKLKLQLEEEQQKCSRNDGVAGDPAGLQNGSDLQFIEMQSRTGLGTTPRGAGCVLGGVRTGTRSHGSRFSSYVLRLVSPWPDQNSRPDQSWTWRGCF